MSKSKDIRRISDTTDGRLLFLSGLKASRLFFLPDSSSFHSSDRKIKTKTQMFCLCIHCNVTSRIWWEGTNVIKQRE